MNERNRIRQTEGRLLIGVFIILVGILLFAYKMGAGIPGWLFSWPMLIIAIGIISGIKHRFKNYGWFIMVLIGTFFLTSQQLPKLNLERFTAPIFLIGLGLLFISRPRHRSRELVAAKEEWKGVSENANVNFSDGEYIEVNSVFGGVKKIILSKNFKGGVVSCIMGGAEIDLSQADIHGTVILETTQIFGGAKLILPPHWDLKTEIGTVIFGGIEDKRPVIATKVDPSKVLILKGTIIFGGLDINSF